MSIRDLIPPSNDIDSFSTCADGGPLSGRRRIQSAYEAGFHGAFIDDENVPDWSRKIARLDRAKFRQFADPNHWTVEQAMPAAIHGAGAGKRMISFAYIQRVLPAALTGSQSFGNCFPAGTLVTLADGTRKPIELVTTMDSVVTAEGRTGRVYCVMARECREPLRKITCWGHHGLAMTREHPVLTRRGYVPAEKVQIGDWLAIPRFAAKSREILATAAHVVSRDRTNITKNVRRVTSKSAYGPGCVRTLQQIVHNAVPDAIALTYDFGWLIGLFLAEGSTDNARATFSLNITEETTVAAKCVQLLAQLVVASKLQRRPDKGVCLVVIYGRVWAALLESLCGHRSNGKGLHSDLMQAPLECLRGVFDGWMDGDGCLYENRQVGRTVSRRLALDMWAIGNALGLSPAIRRGHPALNRHAATRQECWNVEVYRGTLKNRNRARMPEQDDVHVWRQVRAVSDLPFKGRVFNLSVEGDESYVAEGIGVHNCVAWAFREISDTLLGLALAAGDVKRADVRHGTAHTYSYRGSMSQGMSLGTAAEALTTIGQSEEKDYGGGIDLSTQALDEEAGNRWGRSGAPQALKDAIKGDTLKKVYYIEELSPDIIRDVFIAEGVINTGSTLTAGGSCDPVASGLSRIGGHDQAFLAYDDTDEAKAAYKAATGKSIKADDFFMFMDQSWGPSWISLTGWLTDLWGPRPEGMVVLLYSQFVQLVGGRYGEVQAVVGVNGFQLGRLPDWGGWAL